MATSYTETGHNAGFIYSEAMGFRSRENATIEAAAGSVLLAGTVLGKLDNGKYVIYDPAATDLSNTVAGVLLNEVDPTAGDVKTGVVMVRDCELNANELVWFAGATTQQKTTGIAALKTLGIIAR
jgi:hypothetical protein